MTNLEISIMCTDVMSEAIHKKHAEIQGVVGVYYDAKDGEWTIATYAGPHRTKNPKSAARMITKEIKEIKGSTEK